MPPQAQLQSGFGGGGGDATGFERVRALSGDGTATQELPSGQTIVHAPSARSVDVPTSSPGPLQQRSRTKAASQRTGRADKREQTQSTGTGAKVPFARKVKRKCAHAFASALALERPPASAVVASDHSEDVWRAFGDVTHAGCDQCKSIAHSR